VVDAARIEPVSTANSLANREKYREDRKNGPRNIHDIITKRSIHAGF
jgi:hypothetical protein